MISMELIGYRQSPLGNRRAIEPYRDDEDAPRYKLWVFGTTMSLLIVSLVVMVVLFFMDNTLGTRIVWGRTIFVSWRLVFNRV